MNPLDPLASLPEPLRVFLAWAAVLMPLLLATLHGFRWGADRLYAHALTTPETWDDEPLRRLRDAVRVVDGYVMLFARYVPGPPSELNPTPSLERAEQEERDAAGR